MPRSYRPVLNVHFVSAYREKDSELIGYDCLMCDHHEPIPNDGHRNRGGRAAKARAACREHIIKTHNAAQDPLSKS
jgi:hypothetical protein